MFNKRKLWNFFVLFIFHLTVCSLTLLRRNGYPNKRNLSEILEFWICFCFGFTAKNTILTLREFSIIFMCFRRPLWRNNEHFALKYFIKVYCYVVVSHSIFPWDHIISRNFNWNLDFLFLTPVLRLHAILIY